MSKKGYTAHIYYNTGSYGSPTWSAIDIITDPDLPMKFDEIESTTRASGGVKEFEPGLIDLGFSCKIKSDESVTAYTALETAVLARSSVDIMVLDGGSTTNGSRGYRFDAKIFDWGQPQAIADELYNTLVLKPCPSSNEKKSVVVTSGAPVFTTLAVA